MWIPESANDHGSLDGLADDDHLQYLTTGRHAAVDHAGSDTDALHIDEAGEIAAIAEKETPVPGDLIVIEDSEAEHAKKKVQIGNLPGGSGGGDTDAIRGSSHIDDLETSVQVYHGILATPQPGEIVIQPRNVDHDVQRYAVHGETATEFTVTVDPAPGVGNSFEFGWIRIPASQAPSPPTPPDPPPTDGLILWLEGFALAGLGDGDPVETWPDSSDVGNDASQAVAGNRPTYHENQLNGLGVVRFDGDSHQHLDLPNLYSGATEGEVFIVLKANADPGVSGKTGLWHFGTGNTANRDLWPHTNGSVYLGWGATSRRISNVNPTPALTNWNTLNIDTTSGGTWTARLNGSTLGSASANFAFNSAPVIGESNPEDNSQGFDGDIAAIICYNRVLSSGERADVQSYLTDRFGVTFA